MIREPKDYSIEPVTVYVTDCPGLERMFFHSEEHCFAAIERECIDANIAAAELCGDLSYSEEQIEKRQQHDPN
jgi:hypothetical protein